MPDLIIVNGMKGKEAIADRKLLPSNVCSKGNEKLSELVPRSMILKLMKT